QLKLEDGAVIIGPAGVGRPVENSRAIFHQGTLRGGAIGTLEVIDSSKVPAGADFKDGAQAVGAAAVGGSVKVAVGSLYHRSDHTVAFAGGGKAVQYCVCTVRGDLEDHTRVIGATGRRRSVEVPITAPHQRRRRFRAVRAVGLQAKAVEQGGVAAEREFEDGAAGTGAVGEAVAAVVGHAVELTVRALHQSHTRVHAIGAGKNVQRSEPPAIRHQLPEAAGRAEPGVAGHPIKISIIGLHQGGGIAPNLRTGATTVSRVAKLSRHTLAAAGSQFEDDAAGLSVAAGDGHAVEIPVPALDDLHRLRSFTAVLLLAKVVQRGQGAAGSDSKSRAGVSTVVSSGGGCAVKVAVGCQYQPNRGVAAIRAGKVLQHSQGLCGRIQRRRSTKYKRDEDRFQ